MDPRYRFSAKLTHSEVWWGIWDADLGAWADTRRWLRKLPAGIEASRLNHPPRTIDDAMEFDGLGA